MSDDQSHTVTWAEAAKEFAEGLRCFLMLLGIAAILYVPAHAH